MMQVSLHSLALHPGTAFVLLALVSLVFARFRARAGWLSSAASIAGVAAVLAGAVALSGDSWSAAAGRVRFARPWFLPVPALVLSAVVYRLRSLPVGLSRTRRYFLALGAGLAPVAAALALAGPEWGKDVDRLTVVLAVDRSHSMDLVPHADERARVEELRALASMRDDDRLVRVVFGAEAATEDPAHPRYASPSAQTVVVPREGTDVSAAVRRSLAEIPDESAGRIVLITDGAANRGDAIGAAAAAAAAGVPVDVLALLPRPTNNLRAHSVRVPSAADEGEAFDLRVVTHSTVDGDYTLRVLLDGNVTQTGRVHVGQGEDLLTLRQQATVAGLHRYEVDLSPLDSRTDAIVQDNRAGAYLRVRGPSSVLIVEGDEGRSAPLAAALRSAAFRVEEHGPRGFPEDLATLASYDLVVLSNVPAFMLSTDQMDQLAVYVRDLGGGLLLMGGDRSMGPGGYSRTPVEEISPVAFDLRHERRQATLSEVIAIDFSGSMAAPVSTGQTKLQLANEASARSAALLSPGDRLGVMHVDTTVHWTVPLAPLLGPAHIREIQQRIRQVAPSGGGIIIPVTLTASYEALRAQNSNLRHLLLFGDGSDSEMIQGQWSVVADAYRAGITTSVVSLGRGADTPELEHLSREGHGRFYLVEDATRLPAVFARETILATGHSIREQAFHPSVAAPDVVTRGIDFEHGPPLHGWVVTLPKPRASLLLTGPDRDPILATWQIGVGRVGAFTSDATDRWGAEWLAWDDAQRLWGELARSLVRRPDPLLRVDADTHGGVLHVHADARTFDGRADALRRLSARVNGPDGRGSDVVLDPIGAGAYAGELPLDRPGAYAIAVRDDANGAVVANAGALLLEGEELRPPLDSLLVERLLGLTGGRALENLGTVFLDRRGLRAAFVGLDAVLALLAATMMFVALLARRLAVPAFVADYLAARRRSAQVLGARRVAPAIAAQQTVGVLLARRRAGGAEARAKVSENDGRMAPARSVPDAVELPPTVAPAAAAPADAQKSAAKTAPVETARKGTGSANLDALLARKRQRK